jgi:prepilin-type N-terminal cleavage/methylation domain-containing protein
LPRGFTLLEALAASVVLAILVLGVCSMLTSAYEQSDAVRLMGASSMLARQLSDEITAKPMQDPSRSLGPETGMTARSQYVYVTNYNGYSDQSTAMPLLEGGTLDATGADVYSRSTVVVVGAKPSIDTSSPTSNFGIVTVTVTAANGQSVSIPTFVTNTPVQR